MQKMTNIREIGASIRKERKQQGLTQEQLAAQCGTGLRFLRELEYGKETCQIGKVLQVLQMLGINLFVAKRSGFNN